MSKQVPGTEYAKWLRKKAAEYRQEAESVRLKGGLDWIVLYDSYMKMSARDEENAAKCDAPGMVCLISEEDPFWADTYQP